MCALSTLKQRSPEQPIALVASGVEPLLALIPELPADTLVRGAFTLVVPNPAQRLAWLGGGGTIGVRIPEVTGIAAELLARAGVEVTYREYPDMIHGFILMGGVLDTANAAVAECCAQLRRAFDKVVA